MRTFSIDDAGGKAFLATRAPFWKADVFRIALLDGSVHLWTDFTQSLTVGSTVYAAPSANGWLLTRTRLGVKNTVEVPELEVRLGASDQALLDGVNIKTQIHNGLFDGATIEIARVFMPAPGDCSFGSVLLFAGRMSGATIDAEGVTLVAKGHNVLMNQQTPKNLYQTNCEHTFCDAGCTLNPANYTFTGRVVGGGSSASGLTWTVPAGFTASQFTLGKVTMTSGAASGQVRTVRLAAGISMVFTYPLYNAPSPGDTFSILMGCDRQQASCQTRKQANGTSVDNSQHYRGFPFVPIAEIGV